MMSILIAFFGISKVNLAYERYMSAQIAMGDALMTLRELHQLALTLTEDHVETDAEEWRLNAKNLIIQLIQEMVATLRDGRHAAVLARNAGLRFDGNSCDKGLVGAGGSDDPMTLVQVLRSHLYHDSSFLSRPPRAGDGGFTELQPLERFKMHDLLHEFTVSYRNLLRLASTPMPFALVQMGRTFTYVWTLTIPFVLSGNDFVQEYPSAFTFVILLTYGFIGLEFVSKMLSDPFGDEIINDLNIKGMGTATVIGIEHDSQRWRESCNQKQTIEGDPRQAYARSHAGRSIRKLIQVRQDSLLLSGRHVVLERIDEATEDSYSAMGEGGMQVFA